MRSIAFCLATMASSVLGLKVNFQRFSEPGCPTAFHHNSSSQHDMYIESNKGCKSFSEQAPFESYIADVVKGSDQMADNYCQVYAYTTDDCTGTAFTLGDLCCAGPVCGTPIAEGGYHGRSARVICEKRTQNTTPNVTTSLPSCPATSSVYVSPSASSKSRSKSSSKPICKSTHVKTVTASPASITTVEPITIHASTLLTSVIHVSPTTITGAEVCNMAPALTASAKSVASASAAALMLSRRSVAAAAIPSLKHVSVTDDEADDEDANSVVEEEAKILIFAEIMKKLQDGCGADDM